MKFTKKVLSLLLAIAMLFTITAEIDLSVYAASYWEAESNNSYSTADNLPVNSTIYGVCSDSNDYDWYKFTLPSRGRVNVSFSFTSRNSSGYWNVCIYKSSGNGNYSELDSESVYLYDGSYNFSTLGLEEGTYFIKVNPYSVSGVQYGVTANYTKCNNWEVEFNDNYSTADTLTLNTTMYGVCTDSNDYDWYKFTLPSKEKINVSFSFSKASSQGYWRVSIYKYTGSGNYSELDSKAIYRSDGTYRFSTLGLEAGTYFIKVNPYSVSGVQYNVTVSNNKLSTPKLQTAVNSNGSFKLSWNKVSGATRYGIYMLQAYKWIKSTSATSWTTGTAQYGKKYTYKIIAVNDNSAVKSAYSNAVSVTNNKKLQSTTAKVTVNANGSFKLSWNKVAGATKYGIYMKQDDGSYKWIKTVTGTSWSTGIAQYGKQYSYKVLVANNNKSAQTFSNVVNAKNNKKLQTPTAKITVNANGSFTISWNKIAGATKYGIYLKQADGSYKWIKTVTAGTSFRTAVAPKGKTYSYKVFAANNNSSANSAFSNVVSAKRK